MNKNNKKINFNLGFGLSLIRINPHIDLAHDIEQGVTQHSAKNIYIKLLRGNEATEQHPAMVTTNKTREKKVFFPRKFLRGVCSC
jgi:hypothetical protein